MSSLYIYLLYIKNDIKSQLAYKLDFWTQQIIWLFYTFLPFIGIIILFQRFQLVDSWSVYHIGVLYGIVGLAYDFSRMIGRAFDDFHNLLLSGELDILLLRPHSLVLQLFGYKFFLRRIAGIAQYILVLVISIITIKPLFITLFLLFVLASFVGTLFLFLGLLLIYASTCFLTIRKNVFSDVFIDSTAKVGFYPTEYLTTIMKVLFFYFIPIGLTAFIPMKHILFLSKDSEPCYFLLLLPIFIGVLFFYAAKKIFSSQLGSYSSVNS